MELHSTHQWNTPANAGVFFSTGYILGMCMVLGYILGYILGVGRIHPRGLVPPGIHPGEGFHRIHR